MTGRDTTDTPTDVQDIMDFVDAHLMAFVNAEPPLWGTFPGLLIQFTRRPGTAGISPTSEIGHREWYLPSPSGSESVTVERTLKQMLRGGVPRGPYRHLGVVVLSEGAAIPKAAPSNDEITRDDYDDLVAHGEGVQFFGASGVMCTGWRFVGVRWRHGGDGGVVAYEPGAEWAPGMAVTGRLLQAFNYAFAGC